MAEPDGAAVAQGAGTVGPRWLLEENRPQDVVAILARATAALHGNKRRGRVNFDREACRARGVEVRRGWTAPDPSAAWLPALTAKLARLAALERNFADAVEIEKLEAMAEFAAGAGHEINNPLAIISGRAQLLLRGEADPERRSNLALIHAQAMRVHEMIADVRLFARPPRPESKRVELAALVDRLIEELGPAAQEQAISLCRQGDSAPLEIDADPVQLMVALRALCQNACKAIGHGGHVTITLRQTDGDMEITVADDGPGIKPEVRRHIFDPYYSYSPTEAGRGLGVGLSKCWRIVAMHGGRIDVDSSPGRGAAFVIRLPKPS
jgi:signal transduction histidine kinase